MKESVMFGFAVASSAVLGALCASSTLARAADFTQTNLVSDIPGLATVTDPTLKNAWGVSFIAGISPFWVSNQANNTTTLYSVTGATGVSKVNINPPQDDVLIPTTASRPQGPSAKCPTQLRPSMLEREATANPPSSSSPT